MPGDTGSVRWLLRAGRLLLEELDDGERWSGPLAVPSDHDSLDALVAAHRLGPVLHLLSHRGLVVGAVAEQREAWLAAYCLTLLRNRRLLQGFDRVRERCSARGIELVVFKGPVHATRVYRDAGLRPMIDIDVLARREDLGTIVEVARCAGFGRVRQTSPYHLELADSEAGCRIEVHFSLYELIVDDEHPLLEEVWRSAVTDRLGDFEIRAPSVAVALVLDLAHLLHHDLRVGVRPLLDYAGALLHADRAAKVEHAELLRSVDLCSEHRVLARLLEEDFGWLSGEPGAPVVRSPLAAQLEARWARPGEDEGAFRELAYRDGLRQKVGYLARTLFPRGRTVEHVSEARSGLGRRLLHAAATTTRSLGLAVRGGASGVPTVSLKRDLYRRRSAAKKQRAG